MTGADGPRGGPKTRRRELQGPERSVAVTEQGAFGASAFSLVSKITGAGKRLKVRGKSKTAPPAGPGSGGLAAAEVRPSAVAVSLQSRGPSDPLWKAQRDPRDALQAETPPEPRARPRPATGSSGVTQEGRKRGCCRNGVTGERQAAVPPARESDAFPAFPRSFAKLRAVSVSPY